MAEGRLEDGIRAYQESIDALDALGDLDQRARHQRTLGAHLVDHGRPGEALPVLHACIETCRASQHRVTLFHALAALSRALEATGDAAGALAALREHVELRDGDQRSRLAERVRLAELRQEVEAHRREAERERARAAELERLTEELRGALEVQRLLQQQLLHAAQTDPLTGLANRRHHASAPPPSTRGRSLAVALVDLDHFKAVNDRFGHAVGDEVLVEAARRLKAEVRGRDTVFRWGGEEFCIAMPDTELAAAAAIGERLVRAFTAAPVSTSAGELAVTISVGVAASAGDDFSALLEQADQSMYEAKRSGRCRVVVARGSG
jgi:diguanylate cyclase (GGDEF)-like protein